MSTNLIGYKELSEIQRVELEGNTKQKKRKTMLLTMLITPIILIAAFQIVAFFTDNLGGHLGALTIGIVLSIIFEIAFAVKILKQFLQKDFEGEVVKKNIKRKTTGSQDNVAV